MTPETPEKTSAPAGTASAAPSTGAGRPRTGGYSSQGGPRGAGGPYKGGGRPGGGPGGGRGGRPPMRRRLCRICADKQGGVDWKAVNFLRNFVTERGKILSGRATGTCSRCQRQLTRAIKRARNIALVPTSPFY